MAPHMKALVFENNMPRTVATKLLGSLNPRFYVSALSPMELKEIPEPRLPRPGLGDHPHRALRAVRQRLQAGVSQGAATTTR